MNIIHGLGTADALFAVAGNARRGINMKYECKMCKWKGMVDLVEKRQHGLVIRTANCPKCGADLYSETMNGNGD